MASPNRPLRSTPKEARDPSRVGPILYLQDLRDGRLHLAALLVRPLEERRPFLKVDGGLIEAEVLHRRLGLVVLRYRFSLPSEGGGEYFVDDKRFTVAGIGAGNLQVAYVSCNGQEEGDAERTLSERNVMWQRLARQNAQEPINLLLQGGDQIYADEMLQVHPQLQAWSEGTVASSLDAAELDEIRDSLRDYLLSAYLAVYSQPAPAQLLASVPTLCMWDDHDICDGWGSLPEERLDSVVGQEVFAAAREFFLLFQLGSVTEELPGICLDRQGTTLTWGVKLPDLLLVAPDLRSERRPQRIMGPAGWTAFEEVMRSTDASRVIIMSSVPVLGPRLSWVETLMSWIPRLQKYEDDLRDQWQSRAHRDEWQRMLRLLLDVHEQRHSAVTVVSGEIHLATRGTMDTAAGPLHQVTASGIAHPPPTHWYGRALGTLARLGEAPLADHPIRLHPLPGRRNIYTSQRNYLILQRRGKDWFAWWELEEDGPTPLQEL